MMTFDEQFNQVFSEEISDKDYRPTPAALDFFEVLDYACVGGSAEYQESLNFSEK
jgi:hypothetical protein